MKITAYERELLAKIAKREPIEWGAAVSAALEWLKRNDLITSYIGTAPKITEKGKAELNLFTVIVDSATQTVPQFDDQLRCPSHPDARVGIGYGLAGGGCGPYTFCGVCNAVLSKTQDEEE